MKTLFVGNIPAETTESALTDLFAQYGKVRKLEFPRDIFSGKCRGFALIDMEGHEAREAMAALDGKDFNGNSLKIRDEKPKGKRRR